MTDMMTRRLMAVGALILCASVFVGMTPEIGPARQVVGAIMMFSVGCLFERLWPR